MLVLVILVVACVLCAAAAFPATARWGGLFPLGVAVAILALIVERWPT